MAGPTQRATTGAGRRCPWPRHSGSGTIKAQLALRQALLSAKSHAMIEPELYVVGAKEKFDEDGTLRDEATRDQVRGLVAALVAWGRLLQNGAGR